MRLSRWCVSSHRISCVAKSLLGLRKGSRATNALKFFLTALVCHLFILIGKATLEVM